MGHADEFENDTDREHCRLDLDRVEEARMRPHEFVAKWGAKLRADLPLKRADGDCVAELEEAEASLAATEKTLSDACAKADLIVKALENPNQKRGEILVLAEELLADLEADG